MDERTGEPSYKRVDRFSQRHRNYVREKLKQTLPKLTYRDIRRYREPYHLALCQELHEDELEQSAVYVERLLQLEQDIRHLAGPGSAEWVRPQLRNQIDFLNKLRIGLTEAEQARTQGQAGFDCGAYLQLGLFFMQKPATWWWLAEQLLLQAVAAGQRCKTDGGRREAIARYVYGSFLLDQLEDASAAHHQLEASRKLAAGRDWVSERDMGVELANVFTAASLRLHDATVALIKHIRAKDPRGAVRLSKVAVRRVKGRGWRRQECEALLELSVSLEVFGDPREALAALQRYAQLAGPPPPPPPPPERVASATRQEAAQFAEAEADGAGRCTASLIAAICHLRLGNPKLTETWLERFLEDAKLYGLDEMVAAGHRYIGEFYLSQDYASDAERHLVQSFTQYYDAVASGARDAPTVNALEQTRALAGIATAQNHLPELQETILACRGHHPPPLTLLLRWRDIRAPFWRPFRVPAGSKFQNLPVEEEEEQEGGEEGEGEEGEGGEEEGEEEGDEGEDAGSAEGGSTSGSTKVMHVTISDATTESSFAANKD